MMTGSTPGGNGGAAYTPRNILLTGGAGFIGSHVVHKLVKQYPQYKVVVLDRLDYCANLRNLDAVQGALNFKFIKGDVTSVELLTEILNSEEIDTVMHFAAQTHVDNSFGISLDFTLTNVYGTHILLETARTYGKLRRFIHVSTDEVYGEKSHDTQVPSHEQSLLEPTNPYAATKAAAEMLVKAYQSSYGLPCIITRGNNVYGPHQFPEKLIPKFSLLAMLGRKLPVHGDGRALRSYLYVTDVADAFDVVLHNGVYNIGTTHERSTLDVARSVCEYFRKDPEAAIEFVPDRLFNDRRYFINEDKLVALGWRPRTAWADGLAMTVEWYRKNVLEGSYWPGYEGALVAHPSKVVKATSSSVPLTAGDGRSAGAAAASAAPASAATQQ